MRQSLWPPRHVGWWLAAVILTILIIGFWPSRVDGGPDWVEGTLAEWHAQGFPAWVTYKVIERGANFLLYVPVGAFLLMVTGATRWRIALGLAALLSATVEVAQLFSSARVPSILDVIMNSLGALAGIALAIVIGELARRRRSERREREGFDTWPDRSIRAGHAQR